ncbi:hypothetical protein TH63_03480 [Rufibacter radiotolerans]|uniref:Uncharacterized protein n=1 Tax=Rufibacter radiotolerans TaxID=1379910 RepID=A0A0H4VMB6_9BACT|nr:hypothetical protein [Rufibacter radiotolerans]AKQ44894.1 hypothetical protein TH63_03480 [Rufibacter radiotolerans]
MKTLFHTLFPFPFLLTLAFLPFPGKSQECEQKLKSYKNWKESPNTQWSLFLSSPAGGSLAYIGAHHSTDPAHPQFAQIRQAWQTQKPTLVFFEGPNRGTTATADETIQQLGESGYVRFLAQTDGVKTQSLEMSPQEEVDQLLSTGKFSKEQIKLFFVLREASRLRDRKGLKDEQLQAAIAQLLAKANTVIKGFDEVIPDVSALQVAYQKYWSAPATWWQAPAVWFTPGGEGEKTGGKFTNEINRLNSENRDRYMYRLLSQAVLKGEKVLAVVGRNHVPMQADALKCALGK